MGNGIFYTIFIGLIVGAIARFLMPGKQPMGFILTGALGIAGALLASFVTQMLGMGSGSSAGLIASVIGALVLLFVVGKVRSGSGGGDGGTKT
jgi:uncharacterized membrane protein YeaQ/YmgE (transglycosylase-associated protein family)